MQPVAVHKGSPPVYSQPPWPNKKRWATDTANLSRPKSRTTSATGTCDNRTQVLDNSSCASYLARACDLCFARPLSLATLMNNQDGTLQLRSTTVIAYPSHLQPYFWHVEKNSGHSKNDQPSHSENMRAWGLPSILEAASLLASVFVARKGLSTHTSLIRVNLLTCSTFVVRCRTDW